MPITSGNQADHHAWRYAAPTKDANQADRAISTS